MFKNKTILITGGTGSFGQAMTKRLLETDIKKIKVFSRNEQKQWHMRKTLNDNRLDFIIGDIRDYNSINEALKDVDYVLHAGALKHVLVCEKQPEEAIETNIIGSKNVIKACIANKIKKLVCLSTDKSACAETCYGMTKYAMEKLALGINSNETDIVLTRYGNVLGSSGSVIPLFKELREQGKSLTITDPNMTRFFMPIEQAIDLVLYALQYGNNKDLFVCNNRSATVKQIADCISDNQIIVGSDCSEKTAEALLTINELNHSEFKNDYYRVNQNIISDKIYKEPFTSDNANRFDLKELKELIDRC